MKSSTFIQYQGKSFPLAWLYAPSPQAFFFALRTTAAAMLALGIAFWMELDSPGWACQTVWLVSLLTRGESISKARWRIIGTLTGALGAFFLSAIVPQQAWLMFPLMAGWLGLCSAMAVYFSHFRAYSWVLAGYTCTIITFGAAPNCDQYFDFAIARGSYVIIGILCEMALACIFSFNWDTKSHHSMCDTLSGILTKTTGTIKDLLQGRASVVATTQELMVQIKEMEGKSKFMGIETVGINPHLDDRARDVIAKTALVLSQLVDLSTRLQIYKEHHVPLPVFNKIVSKTLPVLDQLPEVFQDTTLIPSRLSKLDQLRNFCRRAATKLIQQNINNRAPTDDTSLNPGRGIVGEGALCLALERTLDKLEHAISSYVATLYPERGDHFRFRLPDWHDGREGFSHGMRAVLAVLISAFFFEITAWPQGFILVTFTGVGVALNSASGDPLQDQKGVMNFLKGATAAWIAAFFLVMVLLPSTKVFEGVIITLGGLMFIGGLARYCPPISGAAAIYEFFLPIMIGLQNHHLMNEIQFYNNTNAILFGAILAVLTFASLPFKPLDKQKRICHATCLALRKLSKPSNRISPLNWVWRSLDRVILMVRQESRNENHYAPITISNLLMAQTVGLNIIRLETLLEAEDSDLPPRVTRAIKTLLRYFAARPSVNNATIQAGYLALMSLDRAIRESNDLATELELIYALTDIRLILHLMLKYGDFLNEGTLVDPQSQRFDSKYAPPKSLKL
ncbi:FUSC family protein [Acetobacteraceae bacterium]|nr:FUSC family protein [Acetobacteraceae bacterium]